jgi:hypothetical protein
MKKHALRAIHGLFALYFTTCLVYMYYASFTSRFDILLLIAVVSLAIEGIVVFILNGGHCPLIHIQRKIGDDTPFFELFLAPHLAKRAIPIFAIITWIGVATLIISLYLSAL